jgi:hypothetical protein
MLMVGVFGPKYPCEEVFIKHVGNNQYNVQYVNFIWYFESNIDLLLFRRYEKKVNICWLLNGAINIFQVHLGMLKLFKYQSNEITSNKNNKSSPFYLYAYMLENFFLYIFFSLSLSLSSFVILLCVHACSNYSSFY